MKPYPTNFCSGNYKEWMEVFLTYKCQGSCPWCVEKGGFRPSTEVPWEELSDVIIGSGKTHVILLGGEPTLYPNISQLVDRLADNEINVYVTTNGGRLSPSFVSERLSRLKGINISIHSYDLEANRKITGIVLTQDNLKATIEKAHSFGITVRLNCNIEKGYVDSREEITKFVAFAKEIGADSVRLAELKTDTNDFVSLAEILNGEYGLNEDPFTLGCSKDTIIDGMDVSFRQMCGLQTPHRKAPDNPEQDSKKSVLYYDGNIYDGWQRAHSTGEIERLLHALREQKITPDEAIKRIKEVSNAKN